MLFYLESAQEPINNDKHHYHSKASAAELLGSVSGNQGFEKSVHN